MRDLLLGLAALLIGFAEQSLFAVDWNSRDLPAVTCDLQKTNYSFVHEKGYHEDNAFLFMWATHMLETQELKFIKKTFGRLGFSNLSFINEDRHGAQALVARKKNSIFVFLRGSVSLREIFLDALFYQKKINDSYVQGYLHHGMWKNFEGMYDQIEEAVRKLNQRSNRQIFIGGHSLGGAMATLTGLVFEKKGLPLAAVYNSASPRVGDSVFYRDVDITIGQKLYQSVLKTDLVPKVPPAKWSAREFGELIGDSEAGQSLAGVVQKLNYDQTPGQLRIFMPGDGSFKLSDRERVEEERSYWRSMRGLIDEGSFLDVILELRDIVRGHTPGSYVCSFIARD
ncbi:MAG: lipase family protein [Pseudobacteriovorax sp.]|nr:lipase family protein [Pseudobacteriovorax sp.]